MRWHQVCAYELLQPGCGMPALVEDIPVAVFRSAEEELFAVGNVDPFCGAGVMSRGIIGDRNGEPTVSSPMLKQIFSLRTGECLDQPGKRLPTYSIRRNAEVIEVGVP